MAEQPSKMKWKEYSKELQKLQAELCHLQEWVKKEGLRVIIVFEGRDAAGKGGTIKAITERVSPRIFRVVALPAPSDREKTQLFMQRYIQNFPAAGEIVIFDRSWHCVKKTRKRHAVREMKVGPSESPCRRRLQTAISCFGQKPRW